MASREVGLDSLGPKDQEVTETYRTNDYPIVHPETRANISYFHSTYDWLCPQELRVINCFDFSRDSQYKVSANLLSKYLSFDSEADFICYANDVLPGIVGPAIDLLVTDNYAEKIREYDGTRFACGANGGKELNEHLSKLEYFYNRVSYDKGAPLPGDVLLSYMRNKELRDWLDTFATLINEPKLLSSIQPTYNKHRMEAFILAHALQILLFAPVQWHQGVRYKLTDPYPRRFPLGYPKAGPDDVTVCGKYSLDDLYRALLVFLFLVQQRPGKGEDSHVSQTSEPWLGYTTVRCHYPWYEGAHHSSVEDFAFQKLPREIQLRIIELATSPKVTPTIEEREERWEQGFRKIQCTSEDSLLALKLTSRSMYRLVKTANSVEAIHYRHSSLQRPPVLFCLNLEADILRLFGVNKRIPTFRDIRGLCTPLPIRRLLLVEADIHRYCSEDALEDLCNSAARCFRDLELHKLPNLEEYALVLPAVNHRWTMEELPRIRPQDNNESPAHIGTKWQFNLYRYYSIDQLQQGVQEGSPMGVPPSFCDESHLDGTDPSDRPGSIPYVGKYGYERSHGIVGGLWAGFKYFLESKEAYFAPLSWTEVEPLVMGDYGENGTRALFHNHTPQFVSKVWIIRQGTTAPKGWIKVQYADESDPARRDQLWKTWNAVRYTLQHIQDYGSPCPYTLHQR
ncbi:hypothetical protein FNYG_11655 [Fusarium nygamai]|uniref:Uncharacterized protein n=1 Tax=Gibberella nygamai TaxID=42673 RepID=A0A2K0VYA4_GIBNY|nr:hypothetical protein FNYG_11655 [Fusarium nygamai]